MGSGHMRFRYQAEQRIRLARDFLAVRKQGRVFRCQEWFLNFRCPAETEPSLRRFGVIASRRVGNAVVRNRCKRRARELFRLHQHELPESCDLVLVIRKPFAQRSFEDLEALLQKAFAYLLKPRSSSSA